MVQDVDGPAVAFSTQSRTCRCESHRKTGFYLVRLAAIIKFMKVRCKVLLCGSCAVGSIADPRGTAHTHRSRGNAGSQNEGFKKIKSHPKCELLDGLHSPCSRYCVH